MSGVGQVGINLDKSGGTPERWHSTFIQAITLWPNPVVGMSRN